MSDRQIELALVDCKHQRLSLPIVVNVNSTHVGCGLILDPTFTHRVRL